MKKLALPLLAIAFTLSACGQSDAPASEESGTAVKEGDEWAADAEPGAVDVKLPDTPVALDKGDEAAEKAEAETDKDDESAKADDTK